MVKPSSNHVETRHLGACTSTHSTSSDNKYKGVRKRKWGKYVSEIRLPNCRERIWLGSYDTAEKAARAFDAALYCLRGGGARFNFPDDPPAIENGRSMSPAEIQVAAARFANAAAGVGGGGQPGWVGYADSGSDSASSEASGSDLQLNRTDSPSCGGPLERVEYEIPDIPLEQCCTAGDVNVAELGLFPVFNEYGTGPDEYSNYSYSNWQESNYDELNTEISGSFLWNF